MKLKNKKACVFAQAFILYGSPGRTRTADLVMSGHSHSYERSYLLDGHYGDSLTLDPVNNVLDPGDGKETGDGAYEKPDVIAAARAGSVYTVAGSSGKTSSAALDHPIHLDCAPPFAKDGSGV